MFELKGTKVVNNVRMTFKECIIVNKFIFTNYIINIKDFGKQSTFDINDQKERNINDRKESYL